MTSALPRRALVLAGVAIAAGTASVAFVTRGSGSDAGGPPSWPAPGGGWYHALVAVDETERPGLVTECGVTLSAATAGVVHPLLPCGTRLVISYRGVQQAARVVDRTAPLPGRDFAATPALARRLRLAGIQTLDWRFARPPAAASR